MWLVLTDTNFYVHSKQFTAQKSVSMRKQTCVDEHRFLSMRGRRPV
jgi:hypothetical protein